MISRTLARQLAIDYSLPPEKVGDGKNHFTVYEPHEGMRLFDSDGRKCFLKACSTGNSLLMTGREDIISVLSEKLENADCEWAFEFGTLSSIDTLIKRYGYRISQVHMFFISDRVSEVPPEGITTYSREEIRQFENAGFDEAFLFSERTPDIFGASVSENGQIVAMAGASLDSPYMMQIGVNVTEGHGGKGYATRCVCAVRDMAVNAGYLVYYGTSVSHIASQRVAISAGFRPAFCELITEKI